MTAFVHCRGCGIQIHETALSCPKCGAPQVLAVPLAGAGVAPAMTATPATAYAQVPWYRRRWFLIASLLTIAPIAAVVALTGPMRYEAKGEVKTFAPNIKTAILIVSLYYIYTLFTPVGSHQQIICFLLAVGLSIIMGVKK